MFFFHRVSKFVGKNVFSALHCSGKWQWGCGAKCLSPLFLQICMSKFSPCSKLSGMNLHECDADPWLTHLVSELASVAHAGCHNFQFGPPSSSRRAGQLWHVGVWKNEILSQICFFKKSIKKWQKQADQATVLDHGCSVVSTCCGFRGTGHLAAPLNPVLGQRSADPVMGPRLPLLMSARLAGESPHAPCLAAGGEKTFVCKNKFKERF